MLSGKRRAELRSEAHHLSSSVHVGHSGLTSALIKSLDDSIRTHELVKVQLGKQMEMTARDAAAALAKATRSNVVQVIGKTVTLYRENPELKKKRERKATQD
ncbi:MAG: ribosome assembly RNA-binding protein YhbY [Anaerolineae bacterium]|nr:ribosome assembly RNA-binding protein YhbY [Gemmatimonadaceae bacterium]